MNNRYWLFKRHGVFYLQDAQTRQKESLRTCNRREAERIRDARNQAAERPNLGIAMAKAYLSAHDPLIAERTWQDVLDEFSTRTRRKGAVLPLDHFKGGRFLVPIAPKHRPGVS